MATSNTTNQVLHSQYGAYGDEWALFDKVMGITEDLLPVVSNPNATISPNSSIKSIGKTPSRYNAHGQVVGFKDWTNYKATPSDIDLWSQNQDLGICIQTRNVRALDIDITDPVEAALVEAVIARHLPGLPRRSRVNSSKFLAAFRLDGDFRKRRFSTSGGAIEFLAGGNQFVAVGTHPSGVRYEWNSYNDFPTIKPEQFEVLWDELLISFSTSEESRDSGKQRRVGDDLNIDDPVADFLYEKGLVLGEHRDKLHVQCPWESEHTSGEVGDGSTSWLIAGAMGHDVGHFKCLHSHCAKRNRNDYLQAINYDYSGEHIQFEAIRREEQKRRNQEIGEVVSKPPLADQITLKEALGRFVYLADGQRVVDRNCPTFDLPFAEFDAHYAASKVQVMGPQGSRTVTVAKLWKANLGRLSVITKTFKPGAPEFIDDPSGKTAINVWRQPLRGLIEPDLVCAQKFIDHIHWLFGNDSNLFLDWLAHIEQYPGVLPHTGWLHIGDKTGLGRNWIAGVIARLWKGYVAANFNLTQTLNSGFNDRLSHKLIAIVDELREGGSGTRWEHSEQMKSLMNEERRTVNRKYGRISEEYNCCRWLMFSNHQAALPLEDNDRRIEVVRFSGSPKSPEHYQELYNLIDDPAFIEGVAQFLAKRDISDFNPGRHAIKSEAKKSLINSSKSQAHEACELVRDFAPSDIVRSNDLLAFIGMMTDSGRNQNSQHYKHIYADVGFLPVKHPVRAPSPTRVTIVRNVDKWRNASGKELADEVSRGDEEQGELKNQFDGFSSYILEKSAGVEMCNAQRSVT